MSLAKTANRYALEIGFLPLVAFGLWQFGPFDWRFWVLPLLGVWLTYWVKRQVAAQVGRTGR